MLVCLALHFFFFFFLQSRNSVQMDPKALNIFRKFQTAPKPSAKNSRILILSKLFWISNPSAAPEEGRGLFEALKEPKPYPDISKWFQNNRSRFKQAIVVSYIQSSNISNYDYFFFFIYFFILNIELY